MKKTDGVTFSAINSEKLDKFAEFKKFDTIPSQEKINVISSNDVVSADNSDRHRRSLSLDYNKMVSASLPYILITRWCTKWVQKGHLLYVITTFLC